VKVIIALNVVKAILSTFYVIINRFICLLIVPTSRHEESV